MREDEVMEFAKGAEASRRMHGGSEGWRENSESKGGMGRGDGIPDAHVAGTKETRP